MITSKTVCVCVPCAAACLVSQTLQSSFIWSGIDTWATVSCQCIKWAPLSDLSCHCHVACLVPWTLGSLSSWLAMHICVWGRDGSVREVCVFLSTHWQRDMKIYLFSCCKARQSGVKGQWRPLEPKLHPNLISYTPTPNKLEAPSHTPTSSFFASQHALAPGPSAGACHPFYPSLLQWSSMWGVGSKGLECVAAPSLFTSSFDRSLFAPAVALCDFTLSPFDSKAALTKRRVGKERFKMGREKKKKRKLTISPPSWRWRENPLCW